MLARVVVGHRRGRRRFRLRSRGRLAAAAQNHDPGRVLRPHLGRAHRVAERPLRREPHIQRRAVRAPARLVPVPELRLDRLVGELARRARRDIVHPQLRHAIGVREEGERRALRGPHRPPAGAPRTDLDRPPRGHLRVTDGRPHHGTGRAVGLIALIQVGCGIRGRNPHVVRDEAPVRRDCELGVPDEGRHPEGEVVGEGAGGVGRKKLLGHRGGSRGEGRCSRESKADDAVHRGLPLLESPFEGPRHRSQPARR